MVRGEGMEEGREREGGGNGGGRGSHADLFLTAAVMEPASSLPFCQCPGDTPPPSYRMPT